MEHEFTICGRIFPSPTQTATPGELQKFMQKAKRVERDFNETGLKISFNKVPTFTLNSEDIANEKLEQVCQSLSVIFECKAALCKDHEVYGVANVFNGGSDYEVVDEDCYLWIYERGTRLEFEHTKFFNEKFISLPL